jgi:hypothetical protein
VLCRLGAEVPRGAARRFNQTAWPAFAVVVATGIWNIAAGREKITGSYRTTLIAKLVAVLVSGVTASLHARSRSTAVPQGLRSSAPSPAPARWLPLFLGILLTG